MQNGTNKMEEKRYNIKKVSKYLIAGVFACILLLDLIAWPQISACLIGEVGFLIVEAVLFAALCVYCVLMIKRDADGKGTLLGNAIQTVAKYEFLIEQLVSRDFKIKYKRSVLGVFWSFLNPLLMMSVQYVVFSNLLNVRDGSVQHYAIYLLCGIVIFNGFNDCCNQAMRAITSNASLITKVYVPKMIYPVTKVFSASINIVLSMLPLLLVTIVYGLFNGLYLSWSVLLIPIALVLLIMFAVGMGMLLSSLMVFFHDVEFLWGVLSTIWMYATPIIYSTSLLENSGANWLVKVIQFNPMYHYVDFMRTIIINRCSPAISEYVICLLFSVGMLLVGGLVFKKTEDKFVLYI